MMEEKSEIVRRRGLAGSGWLVFNVHAPPRANSSSTIISSIDIIHVSLHCSWIVLFRLSPDMNPLPPLPREPSPRLPNG
jgi:hypothetical protein